MTRSPDLYSFSFPGLPVRKASPGSLPPIVEAIFWDVDGMYAENVQRFGLCDHPQVAAVIAAELTEQYVLALLEANPVVGCSVIYGSLVMRGTPYFKRALGGAIERLLYPGSLSEGDVRLIVHAVDAAITSRDLSELHWDSISGGMKSYSEIRDRLSVAGGWNTREDLEEQFPAFARYRGIVDELKRSVLAKRYLEENFFGSVEGSLENYLKAVFGVLSTTASPAQQQSLEFFSKLDPPLRQKFTFGLQHRYWSNEASSRPRPGK